MYPQFDDALNRLDWAIERLSQNPRNNGIIKDLLIARAMLITAINEAEENRQALERASQYLPYLPDDFDVYEDDSSDMPVDDETARSLNIIVEEAEKLKEILEEYKRKRKGKDIDSDSAQL